MVGVTVLVGVMVGVAVRVGVMVFVGVGLGANTDTSIPKLHLIVGVGV
jgi:hypothetical protein